MTGRLLALDLGGSGGRAALGTGPGRAREVLEGRGVSLGAGGSDALARIDELLTAATRLWRLDERPPIGVGLGIAGLASVVSSSDTGSLRALVRERLGAVPVAIAADGIAAHLGALQGEPGAIVAAGTGTIALGLDAGGGWRRVDGWGLLLGDEGSGADLGRRALRAALRAHDGRGEEGAALLVAATDHFGPPASWPVAVSAAADRAGRLASLVPGIVRVAGAGDALAARLLRDAGTRLAEAALVALGAGAPPASRVSWAGGLFRVDAVRDAYLAALAEAPVVVREPAGDPLDGALLLAADAAGERRIPLPPPPLSA